MEGLSDFYRAAYRPGEYARELKDRGRRIIGYFCSYTPEEIIQAAGVHPMRLFGSREEISLADAHLQAYCCSLVRSALEDALSGDLSFLDGTVFPHTCDSIQRLSDLWRLNTSFGFFADVVLPVKLDTPSAADYMLDVLAKFRRDLEKGLGVTISDPALGQSIGLLNSIRESLGQIYDLRSQEPGLIRGADLTALVKGSIVMDRELAAGRLPEVLSAMKDGRYSYPAPEKRLVVAGSVCDQPDVFQVLEEAGGVVVADDLCTGSRWFEGLVATGGDPLAALAGRYLKRPVCPAKHASLTGRAERLVDLVRKNRADGVIFLLLKFCDPHAFDYPYLKEYLDRENIPNLLVELEDRQPGQGQLTTRFETFIQML